MKNTLLILLFFVLENSLFAQIKFEPGYFINNEGKRTDCLIKNPDRIVNPVKFEYKLSENAPVQTAGIESVSTFEILNTLHKYEKHKVLLERSSRNINKLATLNEIKFQNEEVFLRVLVEGKANLYAFYANGGEVEKFFYKTDTSEVKPLISYYFQNDMGELKENNSFRQELLSNLKSEAVSLKTVSNLRYTLKSLTTYFIRYNKSLGAVYIDNVTEKIKGGLHFSLKAGINTAALELKQTEQNRTFTTQLNPAVSTLLAVELGYALPFNQKKLSIYAEPNFQHYKINTSFPIYFNTSAPSAPSSPPGSNTSGDGKVTITYTHINLPLGLKYSFSVNHNTKLFLQGSAAYAFILNAENTFKETNLNQSYYGVFQQDKITPVPYFNFGIGCLIKNKISIKAESQIGKQMMQKDNWETRFKNSFSLLVGYRLF